MSIEMTSLPPAGIPATVLEYSSGPRDLVATSLFDQQNGPNLPDKGYIFIDRKHYPNTKELRKTLLKKFGIPEILATDTCTKLNGYFGSKSHYNGEILESYVTWFRCLIKMMPRVDEDSKGIQVIPPDSDLPDNEDGKGYIWYEMGFFTQWKKAGHCRLLCIDTPKKLQSELRNALQSRDNALNFDDPFALHTDVLDQIIHLYDTSVWRVRNPVRKVEKARETIKKERAERKKLPDDEDVGNNRVFPIPDFGTLHEVSRHAIHGSEILLVTMETLKGLQKQQESIYRSLAKILDKTYIEQAQEYLSFQLQLIASLKARSVSNHERLKNEIELAYTVLVLQDSEVMRTVALLTMILLPATFLSTFFSTTFFSFEPSGWRVSRAIWIYFVIAVPVTLICLGSWHFWLYGTGKARAILNKYAERRRALAARGGVQTV